MDNTSKKIYKSCDENATNLVQVSSIIDFIKPYMSDNLTELEELRTRLDPTSTNPGVDYTFFKKIVSDWIEKIVEDNANTSLSETLFNVTRVLNFSWSQNKSETNNNNASFDVNLEEKVCSLTYQLNEVTADLKLTQRQLAACVEQNKRLIADLLSLKHKPQYRQVEEHCTEHFNDNNFKSAEKDEEANEATKRCGHLEVNVTDYQKKQNYHLALESEYLSKKFQQLYKERPKSRGIKAGLDENENQALKIKLKKDHRSLIELQKNLELKESKISTLKKVIHKSKSESDKKVELVKYSTKEQTLFNQQISQWHDRIEKICSSRSSTESSPDRFFVFPEFLNQLTNLVTLKLSNSSNLSTANNFLIESLSSSYFHVPNTSVVTVLPMPYKILIKEVDEIIKNNVDVAKEGKHLYVLSTDQKDCLCQNMEAYNNNVTLFLCKNKINNLLTTTENSYNNRIVNIEEKLKIVVTELSRLQAEKIDASTETDNFTKQQICVEQMLQKLKKLEKELASEKDINTKLLSKCHDLSTENVTLKAKLSSTHSEVLKQEERIVHLNFAHYNLLEIGERMQKNLATLHKENSQLKKEKDKLIEEKRILYIDMRHATGQLAIEKTFGTRLLARNNFLNEKNFALNKVAKEEKATSDEIINKLSKKLEKKVYKKKSFKNRIKSFFCCCFYCVKC